MSNSLKVPENEVETKVDIVSKHEQAVQPFEKNSTNMSDDPVPKTEEVQGGVLNQADDMQTSITYEPMTLNYNEMLPGMITDSSQLSSFGADALFDTAEAAAFQLPSFTLAMETAEHQTGKNNQSKVLENSADSKSNKCGASSSGATEKEIKQSKKLNKSSKILESSSSEDGQETESSGKFNIASRKTWSQDDKMCDMLNIVEMITNPVITENNFLSEDSSSASSSCETNNAAANRTDSSEPKDSELGRLHAILEAKGIPLSVFGALGHRMLFQRSMSSASNARVQQLLQGLQADGDEGQQLQAVIEMCQLLVMGNEDTLAGFPVKQVVPVLIKLLEMEHNFEMMNHACRALAYLMEALPRSSSVVIEAVPVLLNKIQVIQCMDVAEQSLTALEMLSKWHNKAVLHAKGIEICLMFFDFFSQNAQRAAFAIIANCCQNILYDEFNLVSSSLPQLSGWLMLSDSKCVESLCLAFSRLVDCMKSQPSHLSEIASLEMLFNVKQLLSVSPCVLSSRTFASVVRMLSQISAASSELSVLLMKQNISETLRFLLIGTSNCDNGIELVPRSAQEMFEIASLICELMPSLPQDGLFAIDSQIAKPKNNKQGSVVWQWRDSTGLWYSYSRNDCKAIESAYLQGKNSLKLGEGKNSSWTIDLHTMQQHNEDSSFIRPVRRYINVSQAASCLENEKNDLPKVDHFKENADLVASCIKELFPILYEVYSSSSEPAVKHKCLATIVRMIYFAPSNILELVLNNQLVAKHIAALLASPDFRLVKKALQISEILMEKLPSVFGVHFIREGVIYEIKALVDKDFNFETQDSSNFNSSFLKSYPQISASNASLEYSLAATRARNSVRVAGTEVAASSEKLVRDDGPSSSKSSKVTSMKKTDLIPKQFDSCCKEAHTTNRSALPLNSELKKKIGTWIKEQAKSFKEKFFSVEKLLSLDPAINVLNQLTSAANELAAVDCGALRALEIIRGIITDSDISSFELIHSGLINKLFEYLTASTDAGVIKHSKEDNLKYFLHVFIGSPLSSDSDFKEKHLNSSPLFALVSKLNACVSHLEQFPVDQPYNILSGKQGTNSFRIFNMGQFKCLFQRHHSCSNLRQWHNGPVMIEPLALIYNINRYLENRGYAVLQNDKESVYDEVDDDLSDPSFDDSSDEEVGSIVVRVEEERRAPKLQFLIGNNVLPYDMTIYRAIRQYGYIENINNDGQEFDSESVPSTSDMWLRTYTIWYRPVPLESEENTDETKITTRSKSDKKKTSSSRNSKKGASERETAVKVEKDPLWDDGIVPEVSSSSLISNLHKTDLTQDPSLDVMYLLKVVHYLNCHWGFLCQMSSWGPAVSNSVFINF
ncbi:E3 ubiquitin-protein ligase TRIP12-like [Stegodyphus dumicola]|uniref:E3 ubiquitin-protein ligase TRIP12-like n=1 Tax=Stegodyphus dumicola TaxID=202533 RepID=UPI0015ADA816|nr:E3 ubiquitin-protein ligase TRIP12-like [Stegodyphus dumicola]